MEHIEEFAADGKDIIYVDFSNTASEKYFNGIIEQVKLVISKYAEQSVRTITNLENVRFDSNIKDIFAEYMKFNKTYVKYAAVIGIDGIKKKLVESIMKMSGRENFYFCFTREKALDWLLRQE
ncbi:MAG: hypothetical protein LBU85_04450 [Treponema sp.]|jgi:hypothetical protein|nr:hypothetical protein [Treponema sp.]